MKKALKRIGCGILAFAVLGTSGAYYAYSHAISPMPSGEAQLVRIEAPTGRKVLFRQLERDGILRNAQAADFAAKLKGAPEGFKRGSYSVKPGMSIDEVVKALQTPIRNMVRLREGWWIKRQAQILEDKRVCAAKDYIELTQKPEEFRKQFEFIPKGIPSLEGYLFPDTYDLPPGMTAKEVIVEQLGAFEKRVKPGSMGGDDLKKVVNIAAMVELEAARDEERARVAGVIVNRIKKGMRLEIDATVLYALQRWFVLGPGVVRTVKSPYNTYLNSGLPPGPIGSPSLKSIEAAINPESHPYLYYVAMPDRSHLFGRTYSEHLANIRTARAAARAAAPQGGE